MLVHYCNCTYNTAVAFSPSVFSQNTACSNCGSISTDIDVRSKVEAQANMQHDELAQLFAANMHLSQNAPQQSQQTQPVPVPQQAEQEATKAIVYASSHYTHSHHVVPTRSASEPPVRTNIELSELGAILVRNSINPELLFPSQVELFQNADDDQRLRLLELWRISPPQGRQGYPEGSDYNMSRQLYDWPPTSLSQEEAMAKLRYEKAQQEEQKARELSASPQVAEPYMMSGYDMLAKREYEQSGKEASYNQATDPVYNSSSSSSSNGLWQNKVGNMSDMENNYGAYAYAREYGFQQPLYADEEMVM
ncbi:uncharacterized protein M421DRAFT_100312 [Didymella exigua CBS 183.55]|uniref:Uncharacterized protein n=1 Tax=Didymella exigua CBS 183.55 TaxID=1150837 RepID=A0A6A5RRB7_9PLEO|nr:uncharacterized protein M421DRAFT_100312 [Didymella exigua CBS 183.55]KAF1929890.1 hypothetical protein M421DRAFT_100312 [Didymella exigua CBS 183.55]